MSLPAAAPGGLLGGWLGDHVGLHVALAFAGGVLVMPVLMACRLPLIRSVKYLPEAERESEWLRLEAKVRPGGNKRSETAMELDVRSPNQ